MNMHSFISFYEEATNKMRFKKVLLVLFSKGQIQITFSGWCKTLMLIPSNQMSPESLDSWQEKSLKILYLVLTPHL